MISYWLASEIKLLVTPRHFHIIFGTNVAILVDAYVFEPFRDTPKEQRVAQDAEERIGPSISR